METGLTYLGFVAISDPPREGVKESVQEARGAGIRSIMITGDNAETAKSIARQVGILGKADLAIEGDEIESLSDDEFLRASVFARASPEHKMAIIDHYKKNNCVVAMTGDGVNDALAISMADVGIAMGIAGTDVTKQAADMIVTDDSFNSIITGVREGRGLFERIRAIIFFYIAVNLAEALIYFGSSFIPEFNLLNTWQQIYIIVTVHSLPPFALIVDRLSKDVMRGRPRDKEGIIAKRLLIGLILFSTTLALVFYTVYFGTLYGYIPIFDENKMGHIPYFDRRNALDPRLWPLVKARTMLHTIAIVAECTLVISLRQLNKSIFKILKEDNYPIAWMFILIVPLAHGILMYVPEVQSLLVLLAGINLEVIRLAPLDWIIALALGLFPIALFELYKVSMRKRNLYF